MTEEIPSPVKCRNGVHGEHVPLLVEEERRLGRGQSRSFPEMEEHHVQRTSFKNSDVTRDSVVSSRQTLFKLYLQQFRDAKSVLGLVGRPALYLPHLVEKEARRGEEG